MSRHFFEAPDVVATWRAFNLLGRVVRATSLRGSRASANLRQMLAALAGELGRQFNADYGLVALGEALVQWKPRAAKGDAANCEMEAEEVVRSTRLHVPVMLESRVVGMLDFHTGSANQGFRTVHLKLLRLISGYLAIIVSRDALARSARVLEDQKAGLVDATIHHHRRDAMLYRVLQLRESSHAGYDQYLTSVLSAICNGIPCAVGVVLVLSGDGKVVAEVSNGLERAMLRRLRTLLSAAQDAVREVGFYSRAFRRESEAAKVRPVKFLMASHVPMQDNQYALVALAKGEGEREFSTAEREAMEVACALVRFPNKVPHQEPRATRVREGSVR